MDNQDILDYDISTTNGYKLLSPKKNVLKQIHSLKSGAVAGTMSRKRTHKIDKF